jgi:DNA-binding transcriptional MerR regulator
MENNDPNPAQQEKPKGLIGWFVRNPIYILLVAIVAILSLWTMNWLFLHLLKPTISERGVFGDQFGAVNALFSGMAFAGIIYSLYLQNRALKDQGISLQKQIESIDKQTEQIDLQREDLRHQKQELELQRDEMRKSREEFERQNFNEVFFSLLRNQQEIFHRAKATVTTFDEKEQKKVTHLNLSGLELFENIRFLVERLAGTLRYEKYAVFNEKLDSKIAAEIEDFMSGNLPVPRNYVLLRKATAFYNLEFLINKSLWEVGQKADAVERVRLAYSILYQKYHAVLAPYFRHLYHILRFISESKRLSFSRIQPFSRDEAYPESVSKVEDEFSNYAQFLQAQLSPVEFTLLFYNSLCYPKLFALTKEFDLFENLELDETIGFKNEDFLNVRKKSKKDLVTAAIQDVGNKAHWKGE